MDTTLPVLIITAVTAVILAAVAGIIMFGIFQSRQISEQGHSFVTGQSHTHGLVRTIRANENMPAAAAYILIRQHIENITEIVCNVCGIHSIGEEIGECLRSHITGRVALDIDDETDSLYIITINGG